MIILMIGVLFIAIAPSLGILSARSETTVLKGMMLGVVQLTSAVIAIVLTVYMLPNEIERRTIYTILSKPVQRWQFLVGKYFGAVGALAIMMCLMSVVMVLMYWLQQHPPVSDIANLLKAPMMYFVQMSLLAAVAVTLSTFVTPIVNFFLSGGLYLMGSLFNPFFETISQNANTPRFAKLLAQIVDLALPNFANYNVQNPIINPQQQIGNETTYFLQATVYGIVYILGLLVVGILIFDRREV